MSRGTDEYQRAKYIKAKAFAIALTKDDMLDIQQSDLPPYNLYSDQLRCNSRGKHMVSRFIGPRSDHSLFISVTH